MGRLRLALRRARLSPPECLLIGLTALVLIAGLTLGAGTPVAYAVVVLPAVVALTWWRPAYGFALLLGLVLVTEEFEILTIPQGRFAGGNPPLLRLLPLYRNLGPLFANALELWLVFVTATWAVQAAARRRWRLAPVPCGAAWAAAVVVIVAAFAAGIERGGDIKVALWEIRALAYLLGLLWLVPQLVERRRDLLVIAWALVLGLGAKAAEGLYRYFAVVHMRLGPNETFMAHEEPVMFVPLVFLFLLLTYHRARSALWRMLLLVAPAMFLVLALTQRRTTYVTLPLCSVFFSFLIPRAALRKYACHAAAAVGAVGIYVLLFAGSSSPLARPIERGLTLFDSFNSSNLYRILENENLHYTITQHPWGIAFGHRYEMFYRLPRIDFSLAEYIPHNEILWVWVKTGTLGFIVIMFFFARMVAESVWTYRHLRDPLLRALAGIVGLAVINQLIVSYFDLQLTYSRSMIYLGTLGGLLTPLQRLGGLARDVVVVRLWTDGSVGDPAHRLARPLAALPAQEEPVGCCGPAPVLRLEGEHP
jgi:O-antigen ligase